MKKEYLIVLSIILMLAFVGCGGDTPTEDEMVNNNAENGEATEDAASEVFFKDNVLQTEKFKLEITDHKVIGAGKKGNEYGDDPVIVFWFSVTNISDQDLTPSGAWMWAMSAFQDNDPNSVNELESAFLMDDEYSKYTDTSNEKIKIGGTVEDIFGYTLTDKETPVKLIASEIFGDEIGSQEFPVK